VTQVVHDLLVQHYDPVYTRSMHRNFSRLAQAVQAQLPDATPSALRAAARQLLQHEPPLQAPAA
jgi:tRNA 2-selenouridine synthase